MSEDIRARVKRLIVMRLSEAQGRGRNAEARRKNPGLNKPSQIEPFVDVQEAIEAERDGVRGMCVHCLMRLLIQA
jgi:hypothetical protein